MYMRMCMCIVCGALRFHQGGNWGMSTLAKPSVLLDLNGSLIPAAADGRMTLNNGKHIVAALLEVKASVSDEDLEAAEWAVPDLLATFSEGVYVDFVQYPSDDRPAQIAMQVLAHETEQNRFRPSSIADKVRIALKVHEQSPGGDWGLTVKKLGSILGASKMSTVYRWVSLARDLDAGVLNFIKCSWKTLNQSYVCDNKYLLGRGDGARYKLTSKYAIIALDILKENLDLEKAVNQKTFQSDFCLPLKHLETWERAQLRTFGRVASDFPAFARVVKSLQTDQGRLKIMQCLSSRLPFSGTGSNTPYGIEEARAVVQEMMKMKAGSDPERKEGGVSLSEGGGEASPQDGGVSLSGAGGGADADTNAIDVDDGDLLIEESVDKNPVLDRAKSLADQDLYHIAVHREQDEFVRDMDSRVLSHRRPIVVIEAPSSKITVFHSFLQVVKNMCRTAALFVPVGDRYDYLSAIHGALKMAFRKRPIFVVSFGPSEQTVGARPTLAIFMPREGVQ